MTILHSLSSHEFTNWCCIDTVDHDDKNKLTLSRSKELDLDSSTTIDYDIQILYVYDLNGNCIVYDNEGKKENG